MSTICPTAALPELVSALLTSLRALGSMPDIVFKRNRNVVAKLCQLKLAKIRVEETEINLRDRMCVGLAS